MKLLGILCSFFLLANQAEATFIHYSALLSGAAEDPPTGSPGTGSTDVFYDDVAHTLRVMASFSGLEGNTTAAHIHAPTAVPFSGNASVATQTPSFSGFPLGVTSGSFDQTYDLTSDSSFRAAFVTANGGTAAGAEAALAAALAEGRAYFNIHSSAHTGGEIRGFLRQVPDSSATGPLLIAGFLALIGCTRIFGPDGTCRTAG
jgi:hypothetical protein